MPEISSSLSVGGSKHPAPFWEGGRPVVLIADPDPHAPEELLDFCRRHGLRALVETSGARALIACGRASPDVVVLSDSLRDIPWETVAEAVAGSVESSRVVLVRDAQVPAGPEGQNLLVEFVRGYEGVLRSEALKWLAGWELRAAPSEGEIVYGSLVMQSAAFDVRDGGQSIQLTLREFELLRILMLAQGEAVTQDQLISGVWGAAGETVRLDTLRVHMNRLRQKLRGAVKPVSIRGRGYRLTDS